MAIKYHKIPKVEKSVCTAEQKIAYNIAWRLHLTYGDQWKNKDNFCKMAQSEFIHELIHKGLEMWKNAEPNSRYDIDGIFSALNAGLENYFNSNGHIFFDYESIGKMFPAHYLKEE